MPVPTAGPVAAAPSSRGQSSSALEAKSKALPFLESPATLDGSMIGDFGFDPLGLTENIDVPYGKRKSAREIRMAEREREICHPDMSRVAYQIACVSLWFLFSFFSCRFWRRNSSLFAALVALYEVHES